MSRHAHRPSCFRTRCLALAALLLSTGVAAQTQLAQYALPGPQGSVGERVGIAGDVDGDGLNDLLVAGAIGVFTYAGADGATLGFQPVTAANSSDTLLGVAGLGDCDGDGQLDVLVATQTSGLRAFSRASGAQLWQVPGSAFGSIGWRMELMNDLNGDGVPDVVAGEPDADPRGLNSAGSIHLISGATGATLHRIDGTATGQSFGRSLSAFADLDGDGRQDVLVGDTRHKVGGVQYGRLLILSGLDGSTLLEKVNGTAGTSFAIEVEDAGDLNGDGVHDMAANSAIAGAHTEAWSGADGSLLWSQLVNETFVLRSAGDANGDGVAELVTGNPGYFFFPGTARVLDGATGTFIASLTGDSPASFLNIAAPGDVTGDGRADILVAHGGPTSSGSNAVPHADVRRLPGGIVAYTLSNAPGGTGLGRAAALAGDFDADGLSDVALLSGLDIAVFSRESGALLAQFPIGESEALFSGPSALAGLGDVNRDGVPDLLMGDGNFFFIGSNTGRALIVSGADGRVIGGGSGLTTGEQYGLAVADTEDRDGDLVRDYYVSAVNKTVGGVAGAGEVQLRSSATGEVLATHHGLQQSVGRFGLSLATGADLDGDGVSELLVGSQEEQPAQLNAGRLALLDGATGQQLAAFSGALNSAQVTGAFAGDCNGDEIPDILAVEQSWQKPGEFTFRGRIRVFSGSGFSLLWEVQGADAASTLGLRYGAAGDVNGDGYADVAASSFLAGTGSVTALYSGRDGTLLDLIDLLPDATNSAGAILGLGRVDAGACDDVLLGITTLENNGGARMFASSKGGVHGFTNLGHAKPLGTGVLPTATGYGSLAANQLVTLRARHLPASQSGTWFIGLSAGNVPFKGGVLVPGPFGPFFAFTVFTNASGEFSITAPNPAAVFTGLSLYHQFWFKDFAAGTSLTATNGLQETFQ